jgi:hypothetical protein
VNKASTEYGQRFLAVRRKAHVHTFCPQKVRDAVSLVRMVVHDQDAVGCCRGAHTYTSASASLSS